jgi:hypothetical protein
VARTPVHMSELKCLGPIRAVKWSGVANGHFPYELWAERWKINELHFLEFSIRVDLEDAEKAQSRLHRLLTDKRIDVSGQRIPKTTLVPSCENHQLNMSCGTNTLPAKHIAYVRKRSSLTLSQNRIRPSSD